MSLEDLEMAVMTCKDGLALEMGDEAAQQQLWEWLGKGLNADYQIKLK
jgi:hypothetical protein